MNIEGYRETMKTLPDQRCLRDPFKFRERTPQTQFSRKREAFFKRAELEHMLALTVSFCLVDIIFADGSTSRALQNGNCAPVLRMQTKETVYRLVLWKSLSSIGYAQSIEISTLVKLNQIISKLTGTDWGNELELKKILLRILLWH